MSLLNQEKLNVFFGVAAVAVLALVVKVQFFAKQEIVMTEKEMVYEMPRPKAFIQELDLSQRGIDRQVNFKGGKAQLVNVPVAGSVPGGKPPVTPIAKVDDKKKKKDDKTKKKPQFTASVVDTARNSGMGALGGIPSDLKTVDNNQANAGGYVPPADSPAPAKAPGNQDDDNKVTAEQWKQVMSSHPSKQAAYELMKAFRKGQVDSATYYQIIKTLLDSQSKEKQDVAIYMLSADYSSKAFEMMVKKLSSADDSLKTKMTGMLQDYAQVQRFVGLAKSLYSKDLEVVKYAVSVLDVAIKNRTQPTQRSDRDIRGLASSAVTVAQYLQFVPALTYIQTNRAQISDQSIVNMAQNLEEQIQTMQQAKN